MIRPFTCVCMLLAAGSGLYLYQTKHRSQMLDRDIADTVHQAEAARERSGLLRAEWTLLNDPQRLGDLAARFLPLKSTLPSQFTSLAELDKRLPPVGTPDAPGGSTDEPSDEVGTPMATAAPTHAPAAPEAAPGAAPGAVASAVAAEGATQVAASASAAPRIGPASASPSAAGSASGSPSASPSAVASATPAGATPAARTPAAKSVVVAAARPAVTRSATRLAERAERAERRAHETASGYGRAAPVTTPVPVVSTIAAPLHPAPAYHPPAYPAAYGQAAPYSGSALGMARMMPSQPGGYAPYGN